DGDGGDGGNGQGGGIFNGGPNQTGTPSLTLQRSLIALNRADGGVAVGGGSAGLGVGGGLYLSPGGVASADPWTMIFANDASTSDDDVFGALAKRSRQHKPSGRRGPYRSASPGRPNLWDGFEIRPTRHRP